ncbi:hypothetical protein ANAPRD1_01338 [Anaplasma phagocytophilum]|nr:hypothetical protein ANAPC5_01342 [Anaplasma phagocytophilum]SCV66821.1 hypothetical protein ANAPRD1_01338 [Anaplasma phagocytophilum]
MRVSEGLKVILAVRMRVSVAVRAKVSEGLT